MSEQELYERYLQERQWNYTSWEDYKKMWESKERAKKDDTKAGGKDERY